MRVRSDHGRVGPLLDWESEEPDFASLCDLGQVTSLFWASVSSFVK